MSQGLIVTLAFWGGVVLLTLGLTPIAAFLNRKTEGPVKPHMKRDLSQLHDVWIWLLFIAIIAACILTIIKGPLPNY